VAVDAQMKPVWMEVRKPAAAKVGGGMNFGRFAEISGNKKSWRLVKFYAQFMHNHV
jgi:hypothetical protein